MRGFFCSVDMVHTKGTKMGGIEGIKSKALKEVKQTVGTLRKISERSCFVGNLSAHQPLRHITGGCCAP